MQKVEFYLDGFNEEGFPIYAGIQLKITRTRGKKVHGKNVRFDISPETEARIKNGNFNMIYLTHA